MAGRLVGDDFIAALRLALDGSSGTDASIAGRVSGDCNEQGLDILLSPSDQAGNRSLELSVRAMKSKTFLDSGIETYTADRNRPDHRGTSGLSPHLRFGEISVRQIWHEANRVAPNNADPYLRQIAWREFSYHLLFHFPKTPREPLRNRLRASPGPIDTRSRRTTGERAGHSLLA